jgi:3,4-dihydroxyphenylacetate 2,3-dioxygenase
MLDKECKPSFYADGQSSGSWNVLITFSKVKAPAINLLAENEFAK